MTKTSVIQILRAAIATIVVVVVVMIKEGYNHHGQERKTEMKDERPVIRKTLPRKKNSHLHWRKIAKTKTKHITTHIHTHTHRERERERDGLG